MDVPTHLSMPAQRWTQFLRERHRIVVPLLIFAIWRVLTLAAGWQSVQLLPVEAPDWIYAGDAGQLYDMALPGGSFLDDWIEPWHRWDSGWYLMNAMQPFTSETAAAFAPLFSLITAVVAPLVSYNYVLAGLIVSNTACAAAMVLLYRLVEEDFGGGDLPLRTIALLAAFPTAFFLTAVYAESLFLVFTLGSLFAAVRRRWLWAGLAAGLATLARPQGLILVVPLGWLALQSVYVREATHSGRRVWVRPNLRTLIAVAAPAIAWAGFFAAAALRGIPSPSQAASAWNSSFQPPWIPVITFFQHLTAGQISLLEMEGAAAVLFASAAAVIVARRFKPVYAIYVWATLFLYLSLYFEGQPFLGMARYVIVLFPCFVALAGWLKTPRRTWVFVLLSGVLQLWLILRFTHWGWVA